MNGTLINKVIGLLESLGNPILAILLLSLFGFIYMLYRSNNNKSKRIETIQESKDKEVKELNKILLEVRESDKEMLVELKNTISRHIQVEQEHSRNEKNNAEMLKRNNELLIQLLAKLDFLLKLRTNGKLGID